MSLDTSSGAQLDLRSTMHVPALRWHRQPPDEYSSDEEATHHEISDDAVHGGTEHSFEMAGGIEDALMITCEDVGVTFLRSEEVHVSEVR